ncbi:hypothetical protein PJP10_31935, partial [Mycobacterium kansasii]
TRMIRFAVGKGDRIRFWHDTWIGDTPLKDKYPSIFQVVKRQNSFIADHYNLLGGRIVWNIPCRRYLQDQESDEFVEMLQFIQQAYPNHA